MQSCIIMKRGLTDLAKTDEHTISTDESIATDTLALYTLENASDGMRGGQCNAANRED